MTDRNIPITTRTRIAATIQRLDPWIPLLATCAALYCLGMQGWAVYVWDAHALLIALTIVKLRPHQRSELASILGYISAVMLPIDIISVSFPNVPPTLQIMASLLWIINCMQRTPDLIEWLRSPAAR